MAMYTQHTLAPKYMLVLVLIVFVIISSTTYLLVAPRGYMLHESPIFQPTVVFVQKNRPKADNRNVTKKKHQSSRMNILLIGTQDLRADFLSHYGEPRSLDAYVYTPNLDALAARSLVLRNTYCQYPCR